METLIKIDTDEFLTNDLHYILGSFQHNLGDGHTWIIEIDKINIAKFEIMEQFKMALDNLIKTEHNNDQEWVRVECTGANCRGLRSIGKGFGVMIPKAKLADYKSGKYRPECNECFCR